MSNPLGYNPVGESAPGLPRHDKPLPGHVPGEYTPIGGDSFSGYAPIGGGYSGAPAGLPGAYAGPSLFGAWSARVIVAFVTYLTLPVQMVLYPIAGLPAFGAGYSVFHASGAAALGFDRSMSNAWTCAWLVLLPAIRLETTLESQLFGYRFLRHIWRIAMAGGFFYYSSFYEQGDPPQTAAIIALVVAAVVHFLLRAKLLRMVWNGLQILSWLRKS